MKRKLFFILGLLVAAATVVSAHDLISVVNGNYVTWAYFFDGVDYITYEAPAGTPEEYIGDNHVYFVKDETVVGYDVLSEDSYLTMNVPEGVDDSQVWQGFWRYSSLDGEIGKVTLSWLDIKKKDVAVYGAHSYSYPARRWQFGDYGCYDLNHDSDTWTECIYGSNFVIEERLGPMSPEAPNLYECTLEPVCTNVNVSVYDEDIWVTDVYTYVTKINPAARGDKDAADFRNMSYRDAETGVITIDCVYYISKGIFARCDEYFMLPGAKDYEIEFSYIGTRYDEQTEEACIKGVKTKDIASYTYSLHRGELSSTEVATAIDELLADASAPRVSETETQLNIPMEYGGYYTLIAVGFDEEGNFVYYTSYEFYVNLSAYGEWKTLGTVEYTDGVFYGLYNVELCTMRVEIEENVNNPGVYRLVNPYATWPYLKDSLVPGDWYIYVNASDPTGVYLESSPIGFNDSNGMMYVYSYAKYYMDNGFSIEEVKDAGLVGVLKDGIITFPEKTLLISFGVEPEEADGNMYYGNWEGTFKIDFNTLHPVSSQESLVQKNVVSRKAVSTVLPDKVIHPRPLNAVKAELPAAIH